MEINIWYIDKLGTSICVSMHVTTNGKFKLRCGNPILLMQVNEDGDNDRINQ